MNKLLTLLTASLALGSAASPQATALEAWASEWFPKLSAEAQTLFADGVSFGKIGHLAEGAVKAAQALKGVFAGAERAKIAQVLLHVTVERLLPDPIEAWALKLVDSGTVEGLIEAAFQRLDGSGKLAPVVDAGDVAEGGVQ